MKVPKKRSKIQDILKAILRIVEIEILVAGGALSIRKWDLESARRDPDLSNFRHFPNVNYR